jgi:Domain of Unknown Function (DUF1080)
MKAALAGSIVLLSAAGLSAADNVLTPPEKAAGWVLLFDGKTLNGWTSARPPAARSESAPKSQAPIPPGAAPAVGSNPRACASPPQAQVPGASHWEIASGTISPCGDPAGYLTSKASYKNFILKVDFRTGEDTNSGVFIRSPNGNSGYEVQIWKAQPAGYNTGSIVGVAKTAREFPFLPDQWNHYEITADGDHLVVVLNGTKTLDVHDSKFSEGSVRLQYQKFPIQFKNLKLLEIKH